MKRRAFTLVELLVVCVILAILASILFSAFSAARRSSKISACANNLAQTSAAMGLYASDHDDQLPLSVNKGTLNAIQAHQISWSPAYTTTLEGAPIWPAPLRPYGISGAILRCPLDVGTEIISGHLPSAFSRYGTSYTYDELAALVYHSSSSIPDPSEHALLFDGAGANHGIDQGNGKRVNCLYADSHVKESFWNVCLESTTSPSGGGGG